MKFVVDAKFEKGQPRLRVLDADTGAIKMEWSLNKVHQMLDEGEIKPEDFLHPERYGMQLLVRNLFLLSCVDSLSDNQDSCCRHRPMGSDWQFKIKAKPI